MTTSSHTSAKYDDWQPDDNQRRYAKRKIYMRKNKTKIGTLNIITLTGKCEELVDLMERRKFDILGLSETKWKGKGVKSLRKGYKIYWHGHEKEPRNGVAFVISKNIDIVSDVEHVNDRIIKLRWKIGKEVLTIIQVYAPQSGCTQEEKDTFLVELEEHIEENNTIVMGDLNAQVGVDRTGYENVIGPNGFGNRNQEGEDLLDFCLRNNLIIKNTFFQKRPSHKITRYSWDGQQKSSIDYIISDKEAGLFITDVKVLPGESLDSDHRLLMATLRNIPVENVKIRRKPKIRVWKLDEPEKKEEYQRRIRDQLPTDEVETGEKEWTRFKKILVSSAVDIVGKTSCIPKEKETSWWNDSVQQAIKDRNTARRERDKENLKGADKNYVKLRELEQKYRDLKLRAKRVIKSEKEKNWLEFTDKLVEDSKGNKKLLYRIVKNKRTIHVPIKALERDDGTITWREEDIREEMRRYFSSLYNGTDPAEIIQEDLELDTGNKTGNSESPLTWFEIENALKSMSKGRSPGLDEVSSDMIKAAGIHGLQWLVRVMNAVWTEEKIPTDWTKGCIVPLFKKGNRRICSNYRGITLLSHGLKLMEKVIEKRLRKIIEPQLEEEQYGFRSNRSTTDLIFAVRMIMEKHWEKGQNVIFVFLDLEKAYDSILRSKLWDCLGSRNVPASLISKVQMLYKHCQSCVRIGNDYSNWFVTSKGVQQGSTLSPLLFITVMDEIMKRVKQHSKNSTFKAFAFADDVVIWGGNEEEVQGKINTWNYHFKEFGLKISLKKTVVMTVNRQRSGASITVDGQKLQEVNHFQYLGSVLTEDNRSNAEITNRAQRGAALYHQVRSLLWDSQIPILAKRTLYQTYFLPITTYGLETCTITGRDKSRLQAAEMKFLRTMIQKTRRDKVRNERIRQEIPIREPLCDTIIRSRLKWYGHVMRMDSCSVAKEWLEKTLDGKRPRGRPRKRWIEQVKQDVEHRGVDWNQVQEEEWYLNRLKWRALIHRTRETGDG